MTGPIREDQEMYLKILYEAHKRDSTRPIRTSEVAEAMGVTAASASEMLKRLGVKGFVDHVPYKGVTLNAQGVVAASRVKRREALLEIFLERVLHFQGDINDAACRLEHALTDDLELAIDRILGFPDQALDGSPFPPRTHNASSRSGIRLMALEMLPEGTVGIVELRALDGAGRDSLSQLGLEVGARILRTADGLLIDGSHHLVSQSLLEHILVQPQ